MSLTQEERDKREEEIFRKRYERNLEEHDCGYWGVCDDHACPCSIDKNVDGFQFETYRSMLRELNKIVEDDHRYYGD